MIGRARTQHVERTRHIDKHMVARGGAAVEEQSVQDRGLKEPHRPLLLHLAGDRLDRRLAAFDAAAGQMPARDIGMTHEQDVALPRHHGAHAQSHGPGEPEPHMHRPHSRPLPAHGIPRFGSDRLEAPGRPACQTLSLSNAQLVKRSASETPGLSNAWLAEPRPAARP
jgi:hypothetical protein